MQLKKEDLEKAKQVKEFLEKNYQESYGYKLLCKKFAINKKNLVMAFTIVANDTIHAFVTKVRIKHAKILLSTTELNIGLIAVRVGLDKSNFNIQFKKLTGKTPSEWRKNPLSDFKLYYEETSESAKDSKSHVSK
jgi:AraC-like DNA-binding protein